MLSGNALSAPVPAVLTKAMVKAALVFAAGKLATAGISAGLAEGVLKAMWMTRGKVWLAMALVLGLAVTGAGLLAFGGRPAEEPAQQKKADPAPEAVERAEQLKRLAEARLDVAKTAYKGYWALYELGRGREEAVHLWSRRWLQAQLDLSDKKADRDAALAAYQDRLKKTDEIARSRLVLGNSPVEVGFDEFNPPLLGELDIKIKTTREKFETTWKAYENSREASAEQVCLASVRWLIDRHRARRTIKGVDLKAELQAHLDRIKKVERIAMARFESGRTTNMDYQTAMFFRLQAEEWLAQGKTFEEKDLDPSVSSK
jgi:hypothetical protein